MIAATLMVVASAVWQARAASPDPSVVARLCACDETAESEDFDAAQCVAHDAGLFYSGSGLHRVTEGSALPGADRVVALASSTAWVDCPGDPGKLCDMVPTLIEDVHQLPSRIDGTCASSRLCSTPIGTSELPLTPDAVLAWMDEPVLASCSGTLLDAGHVLTARHCMEEQPDLVLYGLVDGADPWCPARIRGVKTQVPCLARERARGFTVLDLPDLDRLDVVILELDAPLVLPTSTLRLGTREPSEVYGLGHPLGGWMRVSTSGKVTDSGDGALHVRISTFPANSGSPLFDCRDGAVVGVVSRGGPDFTCAPSAHCLQYREGEHGESQTAVDVVPLASSLQGMTKVVQ